MPKKHYLTLEIKEDASPAEIKNAYRRLSRKWHPDKYDQNPRRHPANSKEEAEKKFKEISEANQMLSDPARKEVYDRGGNQNSISDKAELQRLKEEYIQEIQKFIKGERINEKDLNANLFLITGNFNNPYNWKEIIEKCSRVNLQQLNISYVAILNISETLKYLTFVNNVSYFYIFLLILVFGWFDILRGKKKIAGSDHDINKTEKKRNYHRRWFWIDLVMALILLLVAFPIKWIFITLEMGWGGGRTPEQEKIRQWSIRVVWAVRIIEVTFFVLVIRHLIKWIIFRRECSKIENMLQELIEREREREDIGESGVDNKFLGGRVYD